MQNQKDSCLEQTAEYSSTAFERYYEQKSDCMSTLSLSLDFRFVPHTVVMLLYCQWLARTHRIIKSLGLEGTCRDHLVHSPLPPLKQVLFRRLRKHPTRFSALAEETPHSVQACSRALSPSK